MARPISIPLPLGGMFSAAKTAEIPGIYASKLHNIHSTGTELSIKKGAARYGDIKARARIVFAFRGQTKVICAHDNKYFCDSLEIDASGTSDLPCVAYVSNTAIIVDGGIVSFKDTFEKPEFNTSTGKSPDTFTGVIAHHDRLFFWDNGDALDFYFGDIGAIQGDLTRFPLARLGNIRGSILALQSLTIDAGHGMNDLLAVFTTEGDLVLYEGLDPSYTESWMQRARIQIAPPVSSDAFVRVGADLWVLTSAGLVSVGASIQSGAMALVQTISSNIQEDLARKISEGGAWSLHLSADAQIVFINQVKADAAFQYCLHLKSQSWSTANYPAKHFFNITGNTHFTGLDGLEYQIAQNEGAITGHWVSNWFRTGRASILSLRPTIIGGGPLVLKIAVLSDHNETNKDIEAAQQIVEVDTDSPLDSVGRVSLDEIIAIGAAGSSFQIHMEITAPWAKLVNLTAVIA